jgi:tRNA-(ms[2]io[6]A)-hydroxylase
LTGEAQRNSVRALMLGLLAPTDPGWVQAAERDLERLLSDHAHCELKAAQSALSLVARYGGEMPEIVSPLVALAHEETEHFREVEMRVRARGGKLSIPEPDAYVVALRKAARVDGQDTPVLLDRLLISALIEARSCERFKLLAEELDDASLRAFYRELMASEAGHYRLFSRLAEDRFGVDEARARLRTLAEREATLASSLPLGATVHG